jgi:DnaJ-class molecular chaperone
MEPISRDLAARKAARRILDVPENATAAQLKRAYRNAALEHHPDHKGSTPEANRRFALIKCAYELLAFDKPCDELLAQAAAAWSNAPEDGKYRLDNRWGHFCWWREKFFGSGKKKEKKEDTSCI